MRLVIMGAVLVVAMPLTVRAADIDPTQAASHVGETETVCGLVASARYAFHSRGQPTFLNLGRPYPDETFTAVIWGDRRAAFGKPEKLAGSTVCVTGPIKLYRGKPEIVLQSGDQLRTTSRMAAH